MKKTLRRSLSVGNSGEIKLMQLLETAGWVCNQPQDKKSLWDIKAEKDNNELFFEVKFDKMSDRTGNLAIEFFNPKTNKPTGINITQADFWVFVLNPSQVWISSVIDLKNYIKNNNPVKTITLGGDDNSSLYLYKRNELLQNIFYQIDILEPEDLNYVFKFYLDGRKTEYYNRGEVDG